VASGQQVPKKPRLQSAPALPAAFSMFERKDKQAEKLGSDSYHQDFFKSQTKRSLPCSLSLGRSLRFSLVLCREFAPQGFVSKKMPKSLLLE
jgi:hypothetical protein